MSDELKLTPEDMRQAKLVQMMREHKGFPVLVEFWNAQRETIIQEGKIAAMAADTKDARYKWAELAGFDKACTTIDRIVARCEGEDEIDQLEKEGADLAKQ